MYHDRDMMMIIALAATCLFWLLDSKRQAIQNRAFERQHQIEAVLEDPTDDALAAFNAPLFGRQSRREEAPRLSAKIIFAPGRRLLFGVMAALSLDSLFIL